MYNAIEVTPSDYFLLGTTNSYVGYMDCLELVVSWFQAASYLREQTTFVGRHCCLFCTVTYTDLQQPLSVRGRSPPRSLETLQHDLQDFTEKGNGDLNRAKEFNNVIGPTLLDIPLDMVKKYYNVYELQYFYLDLGLPSRLTHVFRYI